MSTPHLLDEFLAQDCDSVIRQLLLAELARHHGANVNVVREFNFNRFNVYLDFQSGTVKVDDELDTGEEGSYSLSMAEFSAALTKQTPPR